MFSVDVNYHSAVIEYWLSVGDSGPERVLAKICRLQLRLQPKRPTLTEFNSGYDFDSAALLLRFHDRFDKWWTKDDSFWYKIYTSNTQRFQLQRAWITANMEWEWHTFVNHSAVKPSRTVSLKLGVWSAHLQFLCTRWSCNKSFPRIENVSENDASRFLIFPTLFNFIPTLFQHSFREASYHPHQGEYCTFPCPMAFRIRCNLSSLRCSFNLISTSLPVFATWIC